jgi:hypothetical protein
MPHYYFDLVDGVTRRDRNGLDCTDDAAATAKAAIIANEVALMIFLVRAAHHDPDHIIRQRPLQRLGFIPRCAHPKVRAPDRLKGPTHQPNDIPAVPKDCRCNIRRHGFGHISR